MSFGTKRNSKQFSCGENGVEHGQSHQNNLWWNARCLTNAANPIQGRRGAPGHHLKNLKKIMSDPCPLMQLIRTKLSGREKTFRYILLYAPTFLMARLFPPNSYTERVGNVLLGQKMSTDDAYRENAHHRAIS